MKKEQLAYGLRSSGGAGTSKPHTLSTFVARTVFLFCFCFGHRNCGPQKCLLAAHCAESWHNRPANLNLTQGCQTSRSCRTTNLYFSDLFCCHSSRQTTSAPPAMDRAPIRFIATPCDLAVILEDAQRDAENRAARIQEGDDGDHDGQEFVTGGASLETDDGVSMASNPPRKPTRSHRRGKKRTLLSQANEGIRKSTVKGVVQKRVSSIFEGRSLTSTDLARKSLKVAEGGWRGSSKPEPDPETEYTLFEVLQSGLKLVKWDGR